MEAEKFCLKWNDFENNISNAFREIREDKDFFDVSLACDDEQIQAHKVILSACSPFFKNILRRHPHQHPLLYLKGTKFIHLQSVLNFMYHGEVNVAQADLNSFLAVAEDLQVKGLTQSKTTKYNSTETNLKTQQQSASSFETKYNKSQHSQPQTPLFSNRNPTVESDVLKEIVPVKSEPSEITMPVTMRSDTAPMYPNQHKYASHQNARSIVTHADDQSVTYPEEAYDGYDQYEEQGYQGHVGDQPMPSEIQSHEGQQFQEPSELLQFVRKDAMDLKYHCTLCEKFSHKWSSCTRNHVESKHFPTTFCYPCDECEMVFNTKTSFNHHRSNKHTAKNK